MSATISSILYAQSKAGIKFRGLEPDPREKLITIMETSETGISEDRIAALEQKLMGMEALVKGLIAELLDFRAVARSIFRETEERNRQELKWGTGVPGSLSPESADQTTSPSVTTHSDGCTMIRPKVVHQPDALVAPVEPEMVRIMQTDGTMKLEPRYGESKHIDSTGGYGQNRKDSSAKTKQSPLIYAAEKDKTDPAKV